VKPKLILIGGGGHCVSCIDVIEQGGVFEIAGIIDNAISQGTLLGYPFLGGDEDLPQLRSSYDHALVTVGQIKSPTVRSRLYDKVRSLEFELPAIVSPRAYLSRHATIGAGTIIMHDVLINARASIGRNCIVNTKALIEHDAQVEDNCHISTAAIINGASIIKTGSFVGSNAVTKEAVKTHENDFIKAGSLFMGYAHE